MQPHGNLIGGRWVSSDAVTVNRNPSDTGDVVGEYAKADRAQALEAIAAARAASEPMRRTTPQERADALHAVGDEVLERRDELGTLLAREEGKTRREGLAEVVRAGQIFRFFAGEALRLGGEHVPSVRPGLTVDVAREPLGVIGLVTPWNFPIAIPAWKTAPALAYGNAVVLKPASLVPGCAWALAEILSRSGLPEGAFNLVNGSGADVGAAIADSPDVDGVSFTGSTEVGSQLGSTVFARHGKLQLEMGGKNPLVVLDDADLDTAVACAVEGAFGSTGQRCTASSRLVVTAGIHDEFVEALVQRTRALRVDHALAEGVDVGPVVDEAQLETDLSYLEIGQAEGAKLRCGGELLTRDTPGHYLAPAVFTETTNDMRINREEMFGPIATVVRVGDDDEALAVANDTEFGLSAGVVTRSLARAERFKAGLAAGMVMVNAPTAGVDFHVPFGGRKGSSYGPREQGRYAAEFYTTVKTAYTLA